jgi:hypothetical protein
MLECRWQYLVCSCKLLAPLNINSCFFYRSVVMVPDPRLDASYHKGADQVLGTLLDFKPSEWDLPPFEE